MLKRTIRNEPKRVPTDSTLTLPTRIFSRAVVKHESGEPSFKRAEGR